RAEERRSRADGAARSIDRLLLERLGRRRSGSRDSGSARSQEEAVAAARREGGYMKIKWTDLLSVAAIAAVAALAMVLYDGLPDPLPTHWNARGIANVFMPKPTGIAVLVALPIALFLLFKVLPAISPRGFRMNSFQPVTDIITLAVTLVVAGGLAAVLFAASGRHVPVLTVSQLL